MKSVSGSLKLYLAQYRDVAAFAQFGSDLDASTRYLLNRGERLTELLKQAQYSPLPFEVMVPLLYAGVNGLLDKVPVPKIVAWEQSMIAHLRSDKTELLKKISGGVMSPEIEKEIKSTGVFAFIDCALSDFR
jgi:F-type H+-transporting ATPase subunit alpha